LLFDNSVNLISEKVMKSEIFYISNTYNNLTGEHFISIQDGVYEIEVTSMTKDKLDGRSKTFKICKTSPLTGYVGEGVDLICGDGSIIDTITIEFINDKVRIKTDLIKLVQFTMNIRYTMLSEV